MKLGHVDDSEDDGIRHFMVNVLQPQFNLHSEDANVSGALIMMSILSAFNSFIWYK